MLDISCSYAVTGHRSIPESRAIKEIPLKWKFINIVSSKPWLFFQSQQLLNVFFSLPLVDGRPACVGLLNKPLKVSNPRLLCSIQAINLTLRMSHYGTHGFSVLTESTRRHTLGWSCTCIAACHSPLQSASCNAVGGFQGNPTILLYVTGHHGIVNSCRVTVPCSRR